MNTITTDTAYLVAAVTVVAILALVLLLAVLVVAVMVVQWLVVRSIERLTQSGRLDQRAALQALTHSTDRADGVLRLAIEAVRTRLPAAGETGLGDTSSVPSTGGGPGGRPGPPWA